MVLPISILCLFARGAVGPGTRWFFVLVYVAFLGILMSTVVAFCWRVVVQRARGIEGRDWPTISATIDEVTVVEDEIPGRYRSAKVYEVTLQYVFHNPEIEVGEYRRMFSYRDEAEAWANSFKGCTVIVHVDPKDPARSVLRKQDLDNAVSATPHQKLTTSS
jgi:hypothetical protein